MFRDYDGPSNINKLEQIIHRSESMHLGEFVERANMELRNLRREDDPNVDVSVKFILFKSEIPHYALEPSIFTDPTMLCIVKDGEAPIFTSRGFGMRSKCLPLLGIEAMYIKDERVIGYRFDETETEANTLIAPERLKPRIITYT